MIKAKRKAIILEKSIQYSQMNRATEDKDKSSYSFKTSIAQSPNANGNNEIK